MPARTSALWLIVLILLPCSAPFSTCELSIVDRPVAGEPSVAPGRIATGSSLPD